MREAHKAVAWPSAQGSVFSQDLVVFALEHRQGSNPHLGLPAAGAVAERWREALVSQANDLPEPVREIISGHQRNGSPLQCPHLAFLPIAFVSEPQADGHLLGVAAALPRELRGDERPQVLRVLGRVHEIKLGPLGAWELVPQFAAPLPRHLLAETWTAYPHGATHWATVTPIAFDRHAKSKHQQARQHELAAIIAAGCRAIGLPAPREVILTAVSAHLGVPPAFLFPRLQRKDGSTRQHAHAILVFPQPVVGPILLGAGRYRGYGACRPMDPRVFGL